MTAPHLVRKLGLWATVSIVAGSVIGSSIFMKPAIMAGQLGSPLLLLGVWVLAGGISLIGASVNAEIGAMLPETGGQYVFFQNMYGPFLRTSTVGLPLPSSIRPAWLPSLTSFLNTHNISFRYRISHLP